MTSSCHLLLHKGGFDLCGSLLNHIYLKSIITLICNILLEVRSFKPPLCKRRWHGGAVTEELSSMQNKLPPLSVRQKQNQKSHQPNGGKDTK